MVSIGPVSVRLLLVFVKDDGRILAGVIFQLEGGIS